MNMLSKRLKELIGDDINKIVNELNFCNKSLVYKWLSENNLPNLSNMCKIANHFKVSIDYLLGRTENYEVEINGKEKLTFHERINEILKSKKITKYKLFKDLGFNKGHQYAWFTLKKLPSLSNIIKLADYLGVSIDFLVGRV